MYLGNMSVPILAQEREWERELGWMSSLYLIGMVFGRVLGGWLLNRVNNLYALHTCICLLVITTLLYGIVSLPALFMGLRVIQGMVQGVTFSLNDILITRILMSVPPGETEVPKQQFAKGMGYYSVAGTLSIFVVGYSGLFLMGKLHFSLMYMVMAIITAVLYIWVSRFITKKKAFVLPQGDKPKWWNFFVFAAIPYGVMAGGISSVFAVINSYSEPISAEKGLLLGVVTSSMTLSIVLSRVFVGHLSSRPERSMVFAISVITLGSLLIWKGQGFLAYGAVLVIGLGFGIAIILFFDMLKRQMNPEMIGAAFATFSIVCFDLMPAFAKWLYGNEAVHQGYENSLGMLIGFPLSSLILFFLYLGIRKNRS
jgi:MFS family permease